MDPKTRHENFQSKKEASANFVVVDGEQTPGEIAIFATCYINYHEPGIGIDLIKVLEHHEIPWVTAGKKVCCGMPKLEQGDLEAVNRLKKVNYLTSPNLLNADSRLYHRVPHAH